MFIFLRRKSAIREASGIPAKRPIFLTADWRHLAMLNYEIDPALLQKYVPRGTELDAWEGKYYVSVVGLMFYKTRLMGMPVPFHTDFEEVNLRFYVRREVDDEVRRGVVFIKELVPRRAIATVARRVYNENYHAMPMQSDIRIASPARDGEHSVTYQWRHGGNWNSLQVKASGEPVLLRDDTQEEFIAEHYWGYATQRNGSTMEYEVEHPRWRIWAVDESTLHCDVEGLYGNEFVEALSKEPTSAFLAEGSDVVVRNSVVIG